MRFTALARSADDVVHLHVVAGADTPIAQDARLQVHRDDGRRQVGRHRRVRACGGEPRRIGLYLNTQTREFVLFGRLAAVIRMRLPGLQQFHQCAARPVHAVRVRAHDHAFFDLPDAGRRQCTGVLHVDHADAANGDGLQFGIVAQGGDVYTGGASRFPDRGAGRRIQASAVDRQRDGATMHPDRPRCSPHGRPVDNRAMRRRRGNGGAPR